MVHRRFWFMAALAVTLIACSEDDADDACSTEVIVDDATGLSAARALASVDSLPLSRAIDEVFGPEARAAITAQGSTLGAAASSSASRALVRDFVETVLEDADPRAASSFLHAAYVQHAVAPRPLGTPRALFDAFPDPGSRITYGKLEQIVADGNLVLARSAGRVAGSPRALYDLFRLRDGRIVEHWGVARPAPPRI